MARDARGDKISCMGDEFWGPPVPTVENGICHTFNPCFGFPVGKKCSSDAHCGHCDPLLEGGVCTEGRCDCTLCAAGRNCAVPPLQIDIGRGNGVRILANTHIGQSPVLLRTTNAKFTNSIGVLIHNQEGRHLLEAAREAAPQFFTEWSLAQRGQEEAPHPCSPHPALLPPFPLRLLSYVSD